MTHELDIAVSGVPGTATTVNLILPADLPFEDWEIIGRKLQDAKESIKWWIGDWLAYGESTYGEKYAQAVEVTGYEQQTLYNAAYVSKAIPVSNRHPELPWTSHEPVASLSKDKQAEVLQAAHDNGWTRDEIREHVRTVKQRKLADENEYEVTVALMLTKTFSVHATSENQAGRRVITQLRDGIVQDDFEITEIREI